MADLDFITPYNLPILRNDLTERQEKLRKEKIAEDSKADALRQSAAKKGDEIRAIEFLKEHLQATWKKYQETVAARKKHE
jgi:hypothetical protein